jgi:hypothetical protein
MGGRLRVFPDTSFEKLCFENFFGSGGDAGRKVQIHWSAYALWAWRKGRDSNPRWELPHVRFRVECLKPDSATLPLRTLRSLLESDGVGKEKVPEFRILPGIAGWGLRGGRMNG